MLVPKGQVVHQTREQPRLKSAEEEAHCCNARKTIRGGRENGHPTPAKHEKGQPARGAELLQEDVGRDFEESVGDEKDHEGDDELGLGHLGLVLHIIVGGRVENHGVADIGAVEETEKVDCGREGNDAHVLLPNETLFEGTGMVDIVGKGLVL